MNPYPLAFDDIVETGGLVINNMILPGPPVGFNHTQDIIRVQVFKPGFETLWFLDAHDSLDRGADHYNPAAVRAGRIHGNPVDGEIYCFFEERKQVEFVWLAEWLDHVERPVDQ